MGELCSLDGDYLGDALMVDMSEPAPRALRLVRVLAGLGMLALAAGVTLLLIQFDRGLWHGLPDSHLAAHLVLYGIGAFVTCWVGLTIVGCAAAGMFSLALALTRRGW